MQAGTWNLSDWLSYHLLEETAVAKFLLFCILMVLCWPVALLALLLYPLIWLLLLPLRLVGIAVGGVMAFIRALFFFPARVLGGAGR
jgi:hypothetical protein